MASSSSFVSAQPPKRRRYCLSLRKPAVIHQNVQLVPPAGYDDEGKLPESLPPTPIIDLITEDEATDVERTPHHRAEPQPQVQQPQVQQLQVQQPSVEELNPEDLENEEQFLTPRPPPLAQPLRARGGKTMAAMLASYRVASPASSSGSPPPSQASQDVPQDDVFMYLEAEELRLQKARRRIENLAPNIRERREASVAKLTQLREELAAVERRIQEELEVQQQCDAALLRIENCLNL